MKNHNADITLDHMFILSIPMPLILSCYFYASLSIFTALFLLIGWFLFCILRFPVKKFIFFQILIVLSFTITCFYEINEYDTKKQMLADVKNLEWTGILMDMPKRTDHAYMFSIQIEHQKKKLEFRVLATKDFIEPTKQKMEDVSIGTTVKIKGELSENQGFQNKYGFDAKKYARQTNQMGSIFLHEVPQIFDQQNHPPSLLVMKFRQILLEKVDNALNDSSAKAYIEALVFGERAHMDDEISDLYQKYGLVHLLAISGMQIHLFTFGLFALLLRFGFTKERLYIFLLALQPALYLLTGASTSVGRACVTTAIFLLFQIFSIKKDISFPLALAFFATVYINPDVCLDIGFQLSFFLSACLIFSRNIFAKMNHAFTQMVLASFICQIASLPILLFHFHTYAPLSFFLNLVFIPFINFFVFPLGLVMMVLILCSFPFLSFVNAILEKGILWSEWLLRTISRIADDTLYFAHPSLLLFLLEMLVLFLLLINVEQKGWRKCKGWLSVFLLVFLFHYISPRFDANAYVSFLDVGQGDCTIMITPYQKEVIMIDSGGVLPFRGQEKNKQIVENVILPYLQAKGIEKIDYYIATHGDMDHIGTFMDVKNVMPIENFILGEKKQYTETEKKAVEAMQTSKKKVQKIKVGNHLKIQAGKLFCLSPIGEESDGNEGSIILLVQLYGHHLYLMGDAEQAREMDLAKQYNLPAADVLKVGHHGSKTSSAPSFIEEISPEYSVLSLGKGNSYGHPHKEVLETLRVYSEKIVQTDQHGQIMFTISKKGVTLFTKNHMLTE